MIAVIDWAASKVISGEPSVVEPRGPAGELVDADGAEVKPRQPRADPGRGCSWLSRSRVQLASVSLASVSPASGSVTGAGGLTGSDDFFEELLDEELLDAVKSDGK